ncbi:MAG: hypothetical protein PHN56_00025 [Candidatus Nanoarchaeia archaeon]|nr:hypothetical protein [Candidatus Nanoarchaeia archaeon]
MTLIHKSILIGDNNFFIESFPEFNNKKTKDKDTAYFSYLFGGLVNINNQFQKYNMSLECVCNINNIEDSVGFINKDLKAKNYENTEISGLGTGNYFHLINNKKIALISHEKIDMDYKSNFIINHPIKNIIADFSRIVEYDPKTGAYDSKNFPFERYVDKFTSENWFNTDNFFNVKLMGIFGHIHKADNTLKKINSNLLFMNENRHNNINNNIIKNNSENDCEFYLKEDSSIKNLNVISEFVNMFRNINRGSLEPEFQDGQDYSHMIIRHGQKYFFYSEATKLGSEYELNDDLREHHNRLGFLLELSPSKEGVSNNKISLVSYMKTIEYMIEFEAKSNNYNSKEFIDEFSKDLEAVLK